MVHKPYYDIGMAVGAAGGLVVPVIRNAENRALPKSRSDPRVREEGRGRHPHAGRPAGGTFTITNGGVFGSLLSTPILNLPQVGILGLHKIQDRPIAERSGPGAADDVCRPHLRPPHRRRRRGGEVPGQGVKELVEDPGALLLE